MARSFPLEGVDRSEYDSFTLLAVLEDRDGEYWAAQVEKDGKQFITGNYYCTIPKGDNNG